MFFNFFRFTLPECREISLPVDKPNKEVIQLLKSKINQGIYCLGQLIVPQKFEKTLLQNGKIITKEVSILGGENLFSQKLAKIY